MLKLGFNDGGKNDGEVFLSIKEICECTGLSMRTVMNLVKKGRLHQFKVGREKYISENEVKALVMPEA